MTGRGAGGASFDDPNREALGLDPIWTGAAEEAPPEAPPEEVVPARKRAASAPEQLELPLEETPSS